MTADVNTGQGAAGGVEDTFTQVENLIGSRFGDTLLGHEGQNGLFGGDGDDRLYGRDGFDELSGGPGNDTLFGGAGINNLRGGSGLDTVDYGPVGQGVEVDLEFDGVNVTTSDRFDSVVEIEVIKATNSRDTLFGDEFANRFFGRAGNDKIDGGEGNDKFYGGEGDDILTGGAGADLFDFDAEPGRSSRTVDSGFDRIT